MRRRWIRLTSASSGVVGGPEAAKTSRLLIVGRAKAAEAGAAKAGHDGR